MWTTAPPPPPGPPRPGNKVPWIPIAAAAAVFVVVLGALGIWWLVKPGDSSSSGPTTTLTNTQTTEETTRTRPSRTTTTEPSQSLGSKLMALLPAGYGGDACQEVHPPAPGALATVDCTAPSTPGGPANARYSLFADQATLDSHFDGAIAENSVLVQCPGSGVDSPTTWHYTDTPAKVEGRIACGTYNNGPDVTWTKNSDLLLADAQSPSLEDLHNWWLKYG
jgi:hypothetical protein